MIGRIWLMMGVGMLLIITACNPDSICLSNQNAVQTGFYSAYSTANKDTALSKTSVFGLGVTDSIYSKEGVQKMFLPLSFSNDTTAFVIENNTLKDTIWFGHTKELFFISRKCGFSFNFQIDTVWSTHTFIDSVALDLNTVNYNENVENVKIYIY